jgi:hypothetical protein
LWAHRVLALQSLHIYHHCQLHLPRQRCHRKQLWRWGQRNLGGPGDLVTFSNCTFIDNKATRFGGGVMLGDGGSVTTCGLQLIDSVFIGNTADHGGSHLYMDCSADVLVEGTTWDLNTDNSQVRPWVGPTSAGRRASCLGGPHVCTVFVATTQVDIPLAGNVTIGDGVQLTCPIGSNFQDTFGGLYSSGAFKITSVHCNTTVVGWNNVVKASTLQFECVPCSSGYYSLSGGTSNGQPGQSDNFPCLPCPSGGDCGTQTVRAKPGYWGAADLAGTVSFTVCPSGYCW